MRKDWTQTPNAGWQHRYVHSNETDKTLYAYIDESQRGDDFYFLGALLGSQEQFQLLETKMEDILLRLGKQFDVLTPETEYHGSEMMLAHRGSIWRRVPLKVRFYMFQQVFQAIKDLDLRIYIEGIHSAKLPVAVNQKISPRERALSHLLERLNEKGSAQCPVQVIADNHHTSETSRSNFNRYKTIGTYGYRSSTLAYLKADLQFIDSHESRALQAADMVTYIYNRVTTIEEKDPRATKEKQKIWSILNLKDSEGPRGRSRTWP